MQIFSRIHPYTYEQMTQDLTGFPRLFGSSCHLETIGASESGRPIYSLLLGNPHSRHHFLIQGAMHGREYMTSRLIMALAHSILSLKKGFPFLLSSVCFHLLPMINPDGVRISQRECLPAPLIPLYLECQEAARPSPRQYARRWKANGQGVDLNRNFPARWEYLNSPPRPSDQEYKGPYPLSAAETRALASYTLSYPFCATVSYHESGSEIYYKYGTREDIIESSRLIAEKISSVTGYPIITGRSLAAGGYKDWAMETLGIPSVTIEIGSGPSPLDPREFETVLNQNWPVPSALLEWRMTKD
ncbi:MAG: M14 family zinc carboxypeptidase [Blautia sp.]|jgi:g-D-glutamyl-meso-diaminopimelate peptidase